MAGGVWKIASVDPQEGVFLLYSKVDHRCCRALTLAGKAVVTVDLTKKREMVCWEGINAEAWVI